jgi:large subunit ribosomal protein L10
MARSKQSKLALCEVLGEKFSRATATLVAEYRGLTAEEIRLLRRDLRNVGSEFKVVKNRVAMKAIDQHSIETTLLKDKLKGPVGIVYVYKDVAAGAKALMAFSKDRENIRIKAGVLDGKVLSPADIKILSDLPSREVLLGRILATLKSPHSGLVTVLNGVNSKLVRVLSAIKDTKSE